MNPEEIAKKIVPILKARGATRASLFGSIVMGTSRPDSDIDVLVELNDDQSLLDFIALKQSLERETGRDVDLVEYRSLKPRLRDRILKQQQQIL